MRGLINFASKRKRVFVISLFAVSFFFLFPSLSFSEEKVQYLKKVGEIKDGFSSERENFFIKITGLCCDDEGNLYAADSGWNKIFKFDSNGKFLMSFGREGQGPGEFMGQRMSNHLKISFGNDGKLYVNDPGNSRISVFTKEGKFLKSHRTPSFTYDTPVVNSKGDIYLLSKSGIKAIDCYDSNFKYKASLLDMEEHLQFPFGKPYAPLWTLRKPYEIELLKVITKNDELIVLSNYSFRVFIFDSKNRLMKKFSIFTDEVKENYENLIKIAKEKENEAGKRAKNFWSWAIPFYPLYIDSDNNICFPLNKENGEKCIYKYTFSGLKLERIICPRSAPWDEIIFNNKKDLIFISKKGIQIGIYRECSINRRLK